LLLKPPNRKGRVWRGGLRFIGGLAAAGLTLLLLIQVLAYLSFSLSGLKEFSFAELKRLPPPERNPSVPKKLHVVAEWPEGAERRFQESPDLAELVKAGQLPPVEERVGRAPLVIVPPDQLGPYGGTWTRFGISPSDVGLYRHRLAYEALVRWDPMGRRLLPNVARRWAVEDGGRSYTFWLRPGMRWSDGQLFTADDIVFWHDDVLKNQKLTPAVSPDLKRGGRAVEVEKIDDYCVRFRFKKPHGLFLELMAGEWGYDIVGYPAHYLKQFHPKYAAKAELDEKVRARGYDFWYQLFERQASWSNPELPTLWAWSLRKPPPARPVVFERNPYYFKVDPQGRQLPYIDRMTFEIFDVETINLKAINGEVGMQGRHLSFENYQLFMSNRAKGGYRVLHWIDGGTGNLVLCPNLNHRDPALRQVFGDKRFRIALSVAINREEINQVLYYGVGRPSQMAPPDWSVYWVPEYERAYIDHDPALANRLLDEMGLDRRGPDGVRLLPDGRPLAFKIETSTNLSGFQTLEMVADYWRRVGIKATVSLLARQLYKARQRALLVDVGVWVGAGADIPVLDPRFFFPYSSASIQAIQYAKWYASRGKKGDKPPPEIIECMELYRRIECAPEEAERIRLFKRIIQLNAENLWVIGTVGDVPQIFLVKDSFRNVPEVAVNSWLVRTPGSTAPECYAIEGGR